MVILTLAVVYILNMSQFKYSLLVVGPAPPPVVVRLVTCFDHGFGMPGWSVYPAGLEGRVASFYPDLCARGPSPWYCLKMEDTPQESKFTGEDDDQPSTLGLPIFRHSRFDTCL